jgi:hypothetical protein
MDTAKFFTSTGRPRSATALHIRGTVQTQDQANKIWMRSRRSGRRNEIVADITATGGALRHDTR